MKSALKNTIYKALATSGVPGRLHNITSKGKLTILMYHGVIQRPYAIPDWCLVDLASFKSQIKYIKKNFDIISLSSAIDRLKSNSIYKPTAVITFDDGFQNNYEYAFPVLKQENIPATIFLATGMIDTDETIWTCHLHHALAQSNLPSFQWNGKTYKLSTMEQKQYLLKCIKDKLKNVYYSEQKEEFNKILLGLGNGKIHKLDKDSPYRMLTTEAIKEMANSNLIEFGAHTISHPILSNMPAEEQEKEIIKSIENVCSITGQKHSLFAYPNGTKDDYNKSTIDILKQHKIKAAVTTINGVCDSNTPIYELNRFGIGSDMSIYNFICTVHNLKGAFA